MISTAYKIVSDILKLRHPSVLKGENWLDNINSHIQLPNCVLKYFRDESDAEKKVWYLDISSGQILKKSARKLGTEKGYFSKAGEIFWSNELETPLAMLNDKVRRLVSIGTGTLFLSAEDIAIAKNYIKAAAVRSSFAQKRAQKNSLLSALFTEQQNHDRFSWCGMKIPGKFDQMLADMSVTILINLTERSMVIPRNCYYAFSSLDRNAFVAPISPRCAFLFLSKNYPESFKNNCVAVPDPAQIEALNICALKYEYIFNCDFVASDSQYEVKFLQHFQQEYRAELESLKQM